MRLLLTVALALTALTTASHPSSKTRELLSMAKGDKQENPSSLRRADPRPNANSQNPPSLRRAGPLPDANSLAEELERLHLERQGQSSNGSPRGKKRDKSPDSPRSRSNRPKKKL
ncbi:unnamed protein product [Aphanomyces euteiches]|uniref:RxLR effector protein n=1 Tax=Aphanomyces euteiches TaxID=100861 RepID=A0A6G0WC94_9STRA|nr:hypothetical protein Ae201684_017029 [Aphanomyces euteiches]KAH9078300.1 hypothetical protein Ae201684P_019391 [Aphanomyces euteiches]KAH9152420.1 hypothetical protein AeRB84_005153 [Aphanomyces euteiches]